MNSQSRRAVTALLTSRCRRLLTIPLARRQRFCSASLGQSLISKVLTHAATQEQTQLNIFADSPEVVFEDLSTTNSVVVGDSAATDNDRGGDVGFDARHAAVLETAPNPFELFADDLSTINGRMQALLSTDNARLADVVTYMFEETQGGKKVRPIITGAVAAAVNHNEQIVKTPAASSSNSGTTPLDDHQQHHHHRHHHHYYERPTPAQLRLGEITEMVHMASLLHDDVLDMADTRRGADSINERFGNKMAVMTGDFLLSRASSHLARVGSVQAIELYVVRCLALRCLHVFVCIGTTLLRTTIIGGGGHGT